MFLRSPLVEAKACPPSWQKLKGRVGARKHVKEISELSGPFDSGRR